MRPDELINTGTPSRLQSLHTVMMDHGPNQMFETYP
jgi:hypothetical protein